MAGSWTVGPQTVTWAVPPLIGDGSDSRGGTPPAFAYEAEHIDGGSNYTASEWLAGTNLDRHTNTPGGKFRITCNMAFFAEVDPLVNPGEVHAHASHDHTFIGNIGLYEALGLEGLASADYTSLRNHPKSTCSGGPINSSLYWTNTMYFEHPSGVLLRKKMNNATFYYVVHADIIDELQRLPAGITFIGGVDPTDRLNTARQAEIPSGQGWSKEANGYRYNGWVGWSIFDPSTNTQVPLASGNTADANPLAAGYARQLVNADGTDPWGGAAEDPDMIIIADLVSPGWWDGVNFRSPNGRDHFRYGIRKQNNTYNDVGPQGWYRLPAIEIKEEYANADASSGLSGHDYRSRLYLSSDRYGLIEENWHPRGSTKHFDYIFAWDESVAETWQTQCVGTEIDGVSNPAICGASTISATQRLYVTDTSPDTDMSNDPVITFHDYGAGAATKDAYGPIPDGTVVPGGTAT